MIRIAFFCAALLAATLPARAQDECSGCPSEAAGKTAWAEQIADLEAKAAKGDKRAEAALTAACGDCGTACRKTMTAKVVKLEAAAAKGDEKAKAKLGKLKWDMVFASVRAAPLSEQAAFYGKACDHGCEISKRSMKILMTETGAKDRADLTAKITALEAKAGKGCGECKDKIASIRAKLAPRKSTPAVLSARVHDLAVAAKGGDKAAQKRLAQVAASIESKPETIVADLKALETKAGKGCQTCVTKLTRAQAALSPAKADCGDCESDCEGCDEECEKTCPTKSKPVNQ